MKKCNIKRKPKLRYADGGWSWGNAQQASNALGLTQSLGGIASSLGNAYGSRHAADTKQRAWGNTLSGAAQGAMAGSAFGPIGTGIGAAAGLIGGLVKSKQEKKAYQDELREQQKGFTLTEDLNNSYNPMTMRNGGRLTPYENERNYVRSLSKRPMSVGQQKQNIDSPGVYFAGTNNYTPFINKKQAGGYLRKPRKRMQAGGDVPYEIEGGEAVLGNPADAELYGGADSQHESELGFIAQGAKHGQMNEYGSEGIPMDAQDEMYVGSDALGLDGRPAGKNNPSVASEMKPYLKYGEKAQNSKDPFARAGMDAAQDELDFLKQQAEEGKFLEELHKLLKAKDRSYEEIMDFIIEGNPNDAAAIMGDKTQPEQAIAEMNASGEQMAQQEMQQIQQNDMQMMQDGTITPDQMTEQNKMQQGMDSTMEELGVDPMMEEMQMQGQQMPEDPSMQDSSMMEQMPQEEMPMAMHGLVKPKPKMYKIGGKIYMQKGGPVNPGMEARSNYSSDKLGYQKTQNDIKRVDDPMYYETTADQYNQNDGYNANLGVLPGNTFEEFEFTPDMQEASDNNYFEQTPQGKKSLTLRQYEEQLRKVTDPEERERIYNEMEVALESKQGNISAGKRPTPDGREATTNVDYTKMTEEELLNYDPTKEYEKVGGFDKLYENRTQRKTTLEGPERERIIAERTADLNAKNIAEKGSSTKTRERGSVNIGGQRYDDFLSVAKKKGLFNEQGSPSEQYLDNVEYALQSSGYDLSVLNDVDLLKDIQPARIKEIREQDPEKAAVLDIIKKQADDILTKDNPKPDDKRKEIYRTGTYLKDSETKKEPKELTPQIDIKDVYGSELTKEDAVAYGKKMGWDYVTYDGEQVSTKPTPKPAYKPSRSSYRNQTQRVPERPSYFSIPKPSFKQQSQTYKQGVKRKEQTTVPADIEVKMRMLEDKRKRQAQNDVIINRK